MKIKLITFAPHPNFGTCLQSYALNFILRKMGHDVEFIYNCRETPPLTVKQYIKKVIKFFLPEVIIIRVKKYHQKNVKNKDSRRPPTILKLPNHYFLFMLSKLPGFDKLYKAYKCVNLQWKKVYKFTYEDGNFNMRRIYTHKQYDEVVADTDLFITGSDQIWNPYCGGYNPMMFVEFGGEKKRVAYSSSISLTELPKIVEQRIKQALLKFKHIGVREQHSVDLLNNLMARMDVRLVVDPTYLLSVEEWMKFGKKAVLEFPLPAQYIFCYFVGRERKDVYEQMVQDAKEFTGINDVIILECYNRKLNYGGGKLYKDGGPYEWVYLLQHSSYVCMDSFHAIVFALKFKKDFVCTLKNIDSKIGSQNTRIYDILNRYELFYKMYISHTLMDWHQPVDYSKVTPIIEAEIKDSMEFLKYEIAN